MKTLQILFLNELADMYGTEKRLAQTLPTIAKASTSATLRANLNDRLLETNARLINLDRVFSSIGAKAYHQPEPRGSASYASLSEWAELLGHGEAAALLKANLDCEMGRRNRSPAGAKNEACLAA